MTEEDIEHTIQYCKKYVEHVIECMKSTEENTMKYLVRKEMEIAHPESVVYVALEYLNELLEACDELKQRGDQGWSEVSRMRRVMREAFSDPKFRGRVMRGDGCDYPMVIIAALQCEIEKNDKLIEMVENLKDELKEVGSRQDE